MASLISPHVGDGVSDNNNSKRIAPSFTFKKGLVPSRYLFIVNLMPLVVLEEEETSSLPAVSAGESQGADSLPPPSSPSEGSPSSLRQLILRIFSAYGTIEDVLLRSGQTVGAGNADGHQQQGSGNTATNRKQKKDEKASEKKRAKAMMMGAAGNDAPSSPPPCSVAVVVFADVASAVKAHDALDNTIVAELSGKRKLGVRYADMQQRQKNHTSSLVKANNGEGGSSSSYSLVTSDPLVSQYILPSPAVMPTPELIESRLPGLIHIADFISEAEETEIVNYINTQGKWDDTTLSRRVQHYGLKFNYFNLLVSPHEDPIPDVFGPLLERLVARGVFPKGAAPNQITVNEYVPGVGIAAHVDTHSPFAHAVCSLGLCSDCTMDFAPMPAPSEAALNARQIMASGGGGIGTDIGNAEGGSTGTNISMSSVNALDGEGVEKREGERPLEQNNSSNSNGTAAKSEKEEGKGLMATSWPPAVGPTVVDPRTPYVVGCGRTLKNADDDTTSADAGDAAASAEGAQQQRQGQQQLFFSPISLRFQRRHLMAFTDVVRFAFKHKIASRTTDVFVVGSDDPLLATNGASSTSSAGTGTPATTASSAAPAEEKKGTTNHHPHHLRQVLYNRKVRLSLTFRHVRATPFCDCVYHWACDMQCPQSMSLPTRINQKQQ